MKAVIIEKQNVVKNLQKKLEKSSVILFCNYIGSNVALVNSLRKDLKNTNAEFKVYKNTLTKRALDAIKISYPEDLLKGPTAIITAENEPLDLVKKFNKFLKANETFTLKAGIFENELISEKDFAEMAKLPSKEELIAKFVGVLKAPLNNLVVSLNSPLQGLVLVLNSVKESKEK